MSISKRFIEQQIEFYISRKGKLSDCKKPYESKFSKKLFPLGRELMTYRILRRKKEPEEGAVALLWHSNAMLFVCALMEDPEIFNDSRPVNDQTWLNGDVMEFFYQPPGREEYYELHAAPNGSTLQLKLPSLDAFRQGYNFEDLFTETGMVTDTDTFKCKGIEGWWGYIGIPFDILGLSRDNEDGGRFSVCRYNYNYSQNAKPQISSTSYYPRGGFHQPKCWQPLLLK